MTKARSTLVSLADTPWYHVVSRCVRRAYLCGDDAATGKNHDHRRGWIVDRVKQLAGVFVQTKQTKGHPLCSKTKGHLKN